MLKAIRVCVVSLLAAAALSAQTPGVQGNWLGTLDAGVGRFRLLFHISADGAGGFKTSLDSLDQDAAGIPVEETTFQARRLTLKMNSIQARFEGSLNEDATEIAGTFTQGSAFTLRLRRAETAPAQRRPQVPQPPFPYESTDVSYESRGSKLAGTLTMPRGTGPFPAALLISGTGPEDRDGTIRGHKPFLVLADALTRSGVAVLRVDDRGTGGSQGPSDQSIDDQAQDALAGVAYLKSRREIDGARIGLVGHSEGALIALDAASRTPDVAYLALLAGPGVPGIEVLRSQGEAIEGSLNSPPQVRMFNRRIRELVFAATQSEPDSETARRRMRDEWHRFRDGLPEAARREVSTPEMEAKLEAEFTAFSGPEVRSFILSDPREALKKLTIPVLAMAGARDIQVVASQNIPAIGAALAQSGSSDYTLAVLPGLNHLFQSCRQCTVEEYGDIEETFSPLALELLTNWVAVHTRNSAQRR